MKYIKLILVLTYLHYVFAGEIIVQRCNVNQSDYAACAKEIIQEFFRNYTTANPEDGIKSTDPVTISSMVVPQEDIGMNAEFKNIKATGFKDVVVSDVKPYPGNKHSELTTKFNLVSEGDIVITITSGKSFHGTFRYEGSIDGVTEYDYEMRKENNIEYYDFAPETVKCVADNTKGKLNPELYEAISKDAEAKAMSDKFQEIATDYYERVLCKVGTVVIKTALDNMRTVGRKGVKAVY